MVKLSKNRVKEYPLRLKSYVWQEIEILKFNHPGSSFNEILGYFIEFGLNDDSMLSKVKSCLPPERTDTCILRKY